MAPVIWALVAALHIGLAGSEAPPRPIAQLVHTAWSAKDGSPTEIVALAQTTDGYLWLGTRSGLVRFDGVRFVPFVPIGDRALPTGGIRSLLATHDGSLWIVSRDGAVSRLEGGKLTTYGEQDGLPLTYRLTESSRGVLVAGTAKGLARFTEGKWEDVGAAWHFPGAQSRAVWFDRDDALWAESEDRVAYLPAGGRQFVDAMPLKQGSQQADFAEERDGTVWMAEVFRSAHTLPRRGDAGPVTEVMFGSWNLLIDRKGSLWIGTAGDGIRRVLDPAQIRGRRVHAEREVEQFTEKDGLLSDVVYAMLEDREGDVWVATSRGLERFREGAFTPVATPGSVRPRFVFAARDTSVWTAAYSVLGAERLSGHGEETIATNFFCLDFSEDTTGALWAVYGNKMFRYDGGRFRSVALGRSDVVKFDDLTIDPSGTVWAYDAGFGLLRQSNAGLERVAQLQGPVLPHGTLFADREGRIWIGQQNRVALYDHGTLTMLAASQGLPAGDVSRFLEDRAGNIWVGGDAGLSEYDAGRFRNLPQRSGLSGQPIYGMLEDDQGAWWIVTKSGVVLLAPGEIDRAMADSAYAVRFHTFGRLDGLPGETTSGLSGPQIVRAADGKIWVATDNGIAFIDPRRIPRSTPAYRAGRGRAHRWPGAAPV